MNMNIDDYIAEAVREETGEPLTTAKNFNNKTVNVDLEEYIQLKQANVDYNRIITAIMNNCKLSYNSEYLVPDNDRELMDVIAFLYPDLYDEKFNELLNEDE